MRRFRRVGVAAVVVGLVAALAPLAPVTATHNTDNCRNEPGNVREQSVSVDLTGNELAFVGADTDFPPGGGALVCAHVLGFDTNVGVVTWPQAGVVRDCSDSRPVSSGECFADSAAVTSVTGVAFASPGIDLLAPAIQTIEADFVVRTLGVVRGQASVLDDSACHASTTSIVPETYHAGAGGGSWTCLAGPLGGKEGGLTYVREGPAFQVVVTGDLVGALQCMISPPLPPMQWFDFVCLGGAGL